MGKTFFSVWRNFVHRGIGKVDLFHMCANYKDAADIVHWTKLLVQVANNKSCKMCNAKLGMQTIESETET